MKYIKRYQKSDPKKDGIYCPALALIEDDENNDILIYHNEPLSDIPHEIYDNKNIDVQDRFTIGDNTEIGTSYDKVDIFRIGHPDA